MKIYEMYEIHPSMETLDLAYIPPESPWHKNRLKKGEVISEKKSLPIKYVYIDKSELGDCIPSTNGGMLVSKRFAELLSQLTGNYQTFSTEVYKDDKLIAEDYISFVLTTKYPALDWERSDCRNLKGFAMNVKKLVLSKDKIINIPKSEKIFRVQEEIISVFATEEAKQAIENAGIQDVGFKEIEVI